MRLFIIFFIGVLLSSCGNRDTSLNSNKELYDSIFKGIGSWTQHSTVGNKAILEAISSGKIKKDPKGLADGVYVGITPLDHYEYECRIILKVENEKIVSVDYNETRHGEREGKKESKVYSHSSAVPTHLSNVYKKYENELISEQSIEDLDGFTGASMTKSRFQMAFAYALDKSLSKK